MTKYPAFKKYIEEVLNGNDMHIEAADDLLKAITDSLAQCAKHKIDTQVTETLQQFDFSDLRSCIREAIASKEVKPKKNHTGS
jgi:hypothetical protein